MDCGAADVNNGVVITMQLLIASKEFKKHRVYEKNTDDADGGDEDSTKDHNGEVDVFAALLVLLLSDRYDSSR